MIYNLYIYINAWCTGIAGDEDQLAVTRPTLPHHSPLDETILATTSLSHYTIYNIFLLSILL